MLIELKQLSGLEPYIKQMAGLKASNFFLMPGEPPTFRVDGNIQRSETDPLTKGEVKKLALGVFGKRQLKRLGKELGILRGTCSTEEILGIAAGVPQRLVIAAGSSHEGYTLAGHTVPGNIPSAESIKLPGAVLQAAESPHGLVIFSGPTGSGKTTAAAAVLDHINATRQGHICLLGDPVEFYLEPKQCILQNRDLGVDMPDFAAGMTAALAQDLDVLYLSEIRTVEELRMCMTVALTGHLVVTVLHAATAEAAIERVASAVPPELRQSSLADLAEALRCVVAMRLLPKASGKGRVAAYNVLVPDTQMRQAIRQGESLLEREQPLPEGCQSFAESIAGLLSEGTITKESADKVLAGM